ncbi:MAG: hypothetical protein Hyperionvirus4_88 [Hyperionvirus sp.]|uniref:Uncharacterized protein n=1 Tax=Hyperionvirus sp. TaxID=2487770 RepID=A0A3G5ABA1_9VIRU|nr:MAG: hypothetical protein Hyperionvirus4_88 [Hyperionvirus sp.]
MTKKRLACSYVSYQELMYKNHYENDLVTCESHKQFTEHNCNCYSKISEVNGPWFESLPDIVEPIIIDGLLGCPVGSHNCRGKPELGIKPACIRCRDTIFGACLERCQDTCLHWGGC